MYEAPSLQQAFQQFIKVGQLIRPYWTPLGKDLVIGLALGAVGLIPPYLTKLLYDNVYPAQDTTLLNVVIAAMLTVSFVNIVTGIVQSLYGMYINSKLSSAMGLMFFNHLQHLPMRFFDEHRVGEVLSRFQDVSASLGMVTGAIRTVFLNGLYLLIVPPLLFWLNWKLALLTILTVPFSVVITAISGRVLRPHWKKTSEAYAELNAFQFETMTHIRTMKALALENHVFRQTREHVEKALKLQLWAGSMGQGFGSLSGVVSVLSSTLFTWFGWRLILVGEITLGDFVAFGGYMIYLQRPISQFVDLFSRFQQSSINFDRMFEYLDEATEQDPDKAYNEPLPIQVPLQGDIELQRVAFGYTDDKSILHDLSVTIPAGKITAIIGPSGSGKTSLLRLLTRFGEPQDGQVLINGQPINEIPLPDLRRQIATVWQEVQLVKGTIWDNLTLGLDSVPERSFVESIVRLCRLDGLIADLPAGYDTEVAEWGASLSGGQRQRLAIARALIRQTPILILDEATSNIDLATEQAILHDLFTQTQDRTVIFVTHRVASAAVADKICILQDGYLVSEGTHQTLLHHDIPYRQLQGLPTTNGHGPMPVNSNQ